MDVAQVVMLVVAGLTGGFIAGLIGVGGGIIFAPVLFFYYESIGVASELVTPLTLGSSLLCTLLASLASAAFHRRAGAVDGRVALRVGGFSALAVLLMTQFVTTQPWYDKRAFQIVFSVVMLTVVVRMVKKRTTTAQGAEPLAARRSWPALAATGSVAGAVSAAAGVGGGVVLVPAYYGLLRLPIHRAAGTSSATIVLISLVGVLTYAATGWNAPVPPTALGYVDVGRALLLSVPAIGMARIGVGIAHRIDTQALRWVFAAIAAFVAVRLLVRAFAGS